MLFWFWVIPAGFFFFWLGMIILWAALANSQSDPSRIKGAWYGFITLAGGIPMVALVSATWPLWLPFAIYADLAEKRNEKQQANPFK